VRLVPASQYTVQQLTEAYNQTRVDYLVPMPMTARRLAEYIGDYDVQLNASAVAVDDDEVIGLCMLSVRGTEGWITRLGVLPSARRHHTGRTLVDHCIDQARQIGIKRLWLEVIIGNTPAHNLFINHGFEETGKLLVLRRPPGAPPAVPTIATYQHALEAVEHMRWLTPEEMTNLAAKNEEHQAWTNQPQTFRNSGTVQGLLLENSGVTEGWLSFEETTLQLRRVIVGPLGANWLGTTYALLHRLHSKYQSLDTVAENIPFDAPYLAAYYAHGYVASFGRIEMSISLE
jgi:ribosomal protein S18 acetylase RimI-like enzyme